VLENLSLDSKRVCKQAIEKKKKNRKRLKKWREKWECVNATLPASDPIVQTTISFCFRRNPMPAE
jgi:hypothetical protein